jgi:hypothetical protein
MCILNIWGVGNGRKLKRKLEPWFSLRKDISLSNEGFLLSTTIDSLISIEVEEVSKSIMVTPQVSTPFEAFLPLSRKDIYRSSIYSSAMVSIVFELSQNYAQNVRDILRFLESQNIEKLNTRRSRESKLTSSYWRHSERSSFKSDRRKNQVRKA